MEGSYFTVKEVDLNNHCPECYSNEGLQLTFKQKFVENAFYYMEGSPDPGGLPYRFLLKGTLLIAFSLLMLQALADLMRNILTLSNNSEVK